MSYYITHQVFRANKRYLDMRVFWIDRSSHREVETVEIDKGYLKGDTVVMYAVRGHVIRAVILDTLKR